MVNTNIKMNKCLACRSKVRIAYLRTLSIQLPLRVCADDRTSTEIILAKREGRRARTSRKCLLELMLSCSALCKRVSQTWCKQTLLMQPNSIFCIRAQPRIRGPSQLAIGCAISTCTSKHEEDQRMCPYRRDTQLLLSSEACVHLARAMPVKCRWPGEWLFEARPQKLLHEKHDKICINE